MQSQTVHMDLPSPKRPNRNAAISDEAAELQCATAYNGTSERAIQVPRPLAKSVIARSLLG